MPRLLAPLLALCALLLTATAQASYITRTLNKPVPGGVAVVDLGPAASAPSARFEGKPVLVVKEQDRWLAIVGLPLTQKPGPASLTQGTRTLPFSVGSKKYPEQRITLKNTRQVNPEPDDLKRIDRELAEQIKAYRSFSPGVPSNLILDKSQSMVPCRASLVCAASSTARSAIPTRVWTSPCPPARRSRPRPTAR